jgi:tRNA threonylcarbamoyladenosine biosynthesis protein TsaB
MKLLGIETATEACSAALMLDGEVIERYTSEPRMHNELILPMCDELLSEAGIAMSQIDAIAFGCGPGAFTGVRIGAAVTQGMALAHDLPVIPISTLANLAQQAFMQDDSYRYVLPAIDARMHEVYWAVYQKVALDEVTLLEAELVQKPQDVQCQQPIAYGVGSGWGTYQNTLCQQTGLDKSVVDGAALPHAKTTLQLAQPKYKKSEYLAAEFALPVYVRDNIAHKKNVNT